MMADDLYVGRSNSLQPAAAAAAAAAAALSAGKRHSVNAGIGVTKRYSSPALQEMDEYSGPIPMKKTFSTVPHEGLSARNPVWMEVQDSVIAVFKSSADVNLGRVTLQVRELSRSMPTQVILEYFEKKLLRRGFKILLNSRQERAAKAQVEKLDCEAKLETVLGAWQLFHGKLVFELQCILQPLDPDNHAIERILMLGFRNEILLPFNLIDDLRDEAVDGALATDLSPLFMQMLLLLQMFRESEPLSPSDVTLERMVALVVNPYIGFLGVYTGNEEPAYKANVPEVDHSKRQHRQRAFISRKSLFRDPDDQSSAAGPLIVVSGDDSIDDQLGSLPNLSVGQRPRLSSESKVLSTDRDMIFV